MSKATRMLAMAGMALVAGATFSAGPAAASTVHGTTSAAQSAQQQAAVDRDRDWVVGYYRTRGECERVGWIGERFNRWDDHDCERVRRGFRILWRLDVERDWHGNGHGWPGGNGHGWPGHGGPGGPGHGGPGGPGHGGPGGPGHGGPGGPGHGGPGGPRR